jgi:anti-sigma B factor antagonist
VSNASDSTAQAWSFTPGTVPGTASLAGEIDFSVTPKVRERLLALIGAGAPEIVLDLSGLAYVDSSGLALFIEARKILAESGRTIRIAAISPQVRKLFNLTQIGELFGLPD